MSRLTRSLLAGVLLLALAAVLILWLTHRPPAIARALPEADAIVYADLRPIRLAVDLTHTTPARSPEYQHFVDETGIVPERDLDEAAFALNRRPDPAGPNGPVSYSEIVTGRFSTPRLEHYLASIGTSRDTYAGVTIYNVAVASTPTSSRDLRIAILRSGVVAISNAPTPEQIHSILDRDRTRILSSVSPSLLSAHFADVPRLSPVWAIGAIGLPFASVPSQPSSPVSLFGLSLPFPADQPLILSLRYVGVVRLRVEALTPSPSAALEQAGTLSTLSGLLRTLANSGHGRLDPNLSATLDSLVVTQSTTHPDRVVVTASIPAAALHSLATSAQ